MRNIRLIYSSVGRPGLDHTALTSILGHSLTSNRKVGISGILCSGRGAFLQALEGERSAVNRLYTRILRDPRHSDCQVLDCGDIDTRSFSPWSMRLVALDDAPPNRLEVVAKHCGSQGLDTSCLSGAGAYAFLSELASVERAGLLRPAARVNARR